MEKKDNNYTILVVDDELNIRKMLVELYAKQGYNVFEASDGIEALHIIEKVYPDLVVSDINMPYMDGFELLNKIAQHYPQIKRMLITGYDLDEYISLIRRYNIGNILTKGSEFNLAEICSYTRALLTGEIFGLKRIFTNSEIKQVIIQNQIQAKSACEQILSEYEASDKLFLEIALDELISNAVYHGVLQQTGIPRELWNYDYSISTEDAIIVKWAKDYEKIGISVEDPKGNLKKQDVLRWLDHPVTEDKDEGHGRGLLLVRKLIDRFIINIALKQRTECILIQYVNRAHSRNNNKPLLIHEI